MNEEFAKRQAQVIEILGKLTTYAKKQKETLVFIGGSAVQVTLEKPKRLSIDLDLYYSGDPDKLIKPALTGYNVEKRQSRDEAMFLFYEAKKENVLVKIDIARFELAEKVKPCKTRKITAGKKTFTASIATPDYLLASKLSSLAINTIGRKPERADFQMNLLKDVYDSNCLLDEFGNKPETWEYFAQIGRIQNTLRKTSFGTEQITRSVIQALLNSTKENQAGITKGTLQSFNQYLLAGNLNKPDYWQMAYRLSACLNLFKKTEPKNAAKIISEMEKNAAQNYANREYAKKCEEEITKKGIDPAHAHELKILAPKALIYLHETLE